MSEELVEHVAQALMNHWFPNGHGGATNPSLKDDYEAWQTISREDAGVAVMAMQEYTSHSAEAHADEEAENTQS